MHFHTLTRAFTRPSACILPSVQCTNASYQPLVPPSVANSSLAAHWLAAIHGSYSVTARFSEDADTYRPERWLTEDAEKLKLMHRSMFQFGGGEHICLGRHISLLEIFKVVPTLLRMYEVSPLLLLCFLLCGNCCRGLVAEHRLARYRSRIRTKSGPSPMARV